MVNKEKRHCCHIPCDKDATWYLTSDEFEDDTDMCDDHLMEWLRTDKHNSVTAID